MKQSGQVYKFVWDLEDYYRPMATLPDGKELFEKWTWLAAGPTIGYPKYNFGI
jgi:hypothetical protein